MNDYFKKKLTKIFTAQMQKIIAKHNPKIIGVVGSVGKTTTKLAITTVLKEVYRVQVQEGNYNTPISIPFIFTGRPMPALHNPFSWFLAWLYGQKILRSQYPYDVVIVELGTDTPGDIDTYKNLLACDISVVTAVSEEHMQNFENLEAVAKEELAIAGFSKTLVINSDDIKTDYLKLFIPPMTTYFSFGQDLANDYNYTVQREDDMTVSLNITLKDNQTLELNTQTIAKQIAKSIAAAVAVADLLNINPETIKQGVAKITPAPGRMQLLSGIKNSTIIDDSYNSSPLAVKAALQTLFEITAPQKVAVLGMMNELGQFSKQAHQDIGELCHPDKLNLLVTIGQDANNYLAESAKAKGCHVVRCKSPFEAGHILAGEIQPKSLILVKGSQNGVFAEEAIKPILDNKADFKLLVRQSSFWLNKKLAQFGNQNQP